MKLGRRNNNCQVASSSTLKKDELVEIVEISSENADKIACWLDIAHAEVRVSECSGHRSLIRTCK